MQMICNRTFSINYTSLEDLRGESEIYIHLISKAFLTITQVETTRKGR